MGVVGGLVLLHNIERFADFITAPVCQLPLSVICTITLLCFSSCAPINCSTYMPSHFFSISLNSLFPFHSPTPPSRLSTLSVSFPAHCGDESFEQHPKALPLVDLHLNSPPPSPSSSSSAPLAFSAVCSLHTLPITQQGAPVASHIIKKTTVFEYTGRLLQFSVIRP